MNMVASHRPALVLLILFGCLAHPWLGRTLAAQETGGVSGTVARSEGRVVLPGVQITVEGLSVRAFTSEGGRFTLRGLPAGSHTLVFSLIGYQPLERTVSVLAGAEAEIEVALDWDVLRLSEVMVDAAARLPQRVVEAPAAVAVANRAVMNDLSITAQAPQALATLTGIDVVQSGVFDYNVNARGFNSSLTRRMLVLQDDRDLAIALLGFQEWSALSQPLGDFKSVEVVRGPGSALYGANAYSGVIDIRTGAARDVVGLKATLAGGGLGTLRGDLRYGALSAGGRIGFKVNAGYSRSDSWTEARTAFEGGSLRREYAEATDEAVGDVTEAVPLFGQDLDATTGEAVGDPDPVTTTYGSARLDYYAADGSVATAEAGGSFVENSTLVTGIGRVQIDEVLRPWARLAWDSDRWNVFGWYAARDTRDAPHRSLGSGAPIVDDSQIFHLEGQANRYLSEGLHVVIGASIRDTRTNTDETLFAAVDEDRSDWYYSGYGQAQVDLGERVQLVGAFRVDDGSLFETQWSPRLALVFSPTSEHSIRIGASRAFQTPTQLERFLRVPAASPADLAPLEAGLRASALGPALSGVPDGELFTTSSAVPVLALGNRDLGVETVRGIEAGYKGQLTDWLYVTVDGYLSELKNFVTDLLPGTNPTYGPWTAPTAVPAGSRQALEDAVRSQLIAAGQPLAALGLTRLQDGSTTIAVSYANAGEATEYGAEVGAGVSIGPHIQVDANYSYFGFDASTSLSGDEVVPNAPRHRGSVSARYEGGQGLTLGTSVRFAEAFDWAAGVYAGRVSAAQTVDVTAGYRLGRNLRVHAVATNVFDQQRFFMYGGSVIRRRILAGITVFY
jgi:iron complex outermembrane receptor protein